MSRQKIVLQQVKELSANLAALIRDHAERMKCEFKGPRDTQFMGEQWQSNICCGNYNLEMRVNYSEVNPYFYVKVCRVAVRGFGRKIDAQPIGDAERFKVFPSSQGYAIWRSEAEPGTKYDLAQMADYCFGKLLTAMT